jgi:hypothetical protein
MKHSAPLCALGAQYLRGKEKFLRKDISGIELARHIHKQQFSFDPGRRRRERSLSVLWDRVLA